MSKLPALAAALITLVATTSGCVVDMVATADLPSATVFAGRGSATVRSGPAVILDDRDDTVIVAPSRRAPAAPPAPRAGSSDARNPVIHAFTANPSNFVPAGQPITFQVVAHDPADQPLQYNWAATGGTLSATTGQIIVWNPPEKPGTYTVSTMISNARGGATSGHQNLIVQADGSAKLTAEPAPAPAAPKVEPKPEPVKPAPLPAPVAAEPCGCDEDEDIEDGMAAPAGEIDEADEGFAMESWTRYGRR